LRCASAAVGNARRKNKTTSKSSVPPAPLELDPAAVFTGVDLIVIARLSLLDMHKAEIFHERAVVVD
jgi:hypothetical protein